MYRIRLIRRSPQGERGFKFGETFEDRGELEVAPRRGSVDLNNLRA